MFLVVFPCNNGYVRIPIIQGWHIVIVMQIHVLCFNIHGRTQWRLLTNYWHFIKRFTSVLLGLATSILANNVPTFMERCEVHNVLNSLLRFIFRNCIIFSMESSSSYCNTSYCKSIYFPIYLWASCRFVCGDKRTNGFIIDRRF